MTRVVLPPQSFSAWTSGLLCCSKQRPTGHSGPRTITAQESFGNRLHFNLLNITLVCNRCTSSRVIMTSAEEHREGRTTWKTINLSSCARSFGKDTIGKHPVWNQNWAWPWFLTSFFYDSPFKTSTPPLAVRCLATFSQISKNITKSFLFFLSIHVSAISTSVLAILEIGQWLLFLAVVVVWRHARTHTHTMTALDIFGCIITVRPACLAI